MQPRERDPLKVTFWRLQAVGWTGYWVLLVVTFLPMLAEEGGFVRLAHLKLVRALLGLGLSSLARLGYRRVARSRSLGPIIAASLFGSVLLGALWSLLGNVYAWWLVPNFDMREEIAYFPHKVLDHTVTLVVWSALYFGIKHWRAFREAHERALRADLLAQQARLAALQNQLQPHFLFNALNSIRALIAENPQRATDMVTEVSEFLRYSLERAVTTRVPLGDEVEAVRSYLEIEAIRFDDKLAVSVDVEPTILSSPVPPFVLLPLVENAIKHGFVRGPRPLSVRIRANRDGDGLRLEVANSGQWRPPRPDGHAGRDGTGTGLRNLEQRLAATLPGRATLAIDEHDGWVRAVITLTEVDEQPKGDAVARTSGR
jgi:hypothetical protein